MEESPQKRVLTDSVDQETREYHNRPTSEMLPADLIARLQNVGRRVRYNVSQGYASNRSTPFTTPNTSPVKKQPGNPYNTPQTSPVRQNIFKTETDTILEALEDFQPDPESQASPTQSPFQITRGAKKRGREDLSDSSSSEADGEDGDAAGPRKAKGSPKRTMRSLRSNTKKLSLQDGTGEVDPNPFLVPKPAPRQKSTK
ncbi:hypothetical protein M408DRAFT_330380 [Serendipita vermifera MAFF 305830]|uniref:Uncharacterized protein n=1 Tax=Serendipita vermifera MAFF 305830 TaxID=933852 RepID=A0A0C3AQC1_SERVB|nr:hypothetical protein M408DRAFT_330380 [Serendipita vermifera MAFF 305830]